MYDKEALVALVRHKALKFGDFTLASGKKATYYLDGKQVTLDAHGARLVAEGILDLLAERGMPDAVGGMSIGADPITSSVVTMSAVRGTPLAGFMVRKEPKGHGTNQFIEGPVQPGDKVVIVEDVVTTGGSSLRAIERAEAFGLEGNRRHRDHRPHGRRRRSLRQGRLRTVQPAGDHRLRHPPAGTVTGFTRQSVGWPGQGNETGALGIAFKGGLIGHPGSWTASRRQRCVHGSASTTSAKRWVGTGREGKKLRIAERTASTPCSAATDWSVVSAISRSRSA